MLSKPNGHKLLFPLRTPKLLTQSCTTSIASSHIFVSNAMLHTYVGVVPDMVSQTFLLLIVFLDRLRSNAEAFDARRHAAVARHLQNHFANLLFFRTII